MSEPHQCPWCGTDCHGELCPGCRSLATLLTPRAATLTDDEQMQALCAQADPDTWFPEKGGNPSAAQRICAGCPIRERCLEVALENGETQGVWGGMCGNDLKRLRLQRYHQRRREAA
jgi:hypothetical protein